MWPKLATAVLIGITCFTSGAFFFIATTVFFCWLTEPGPPAGANIGGGSLALAGLLNLPVGAAWILWMRFVFPAHFSRPPTTSALAPDHSGFAEGRTVQTPLGIDPPGDGERREQGKPKQVANRESHSRIVPACANKNGRPVGQVPNGRRAAIAGRQQSK
jgi:hypothetical protein